MEQTQYPSMQTLIIPDIHNHIENADYWLTNEEYDLVVFLGDYFDHFGDDVNDARRTALWLRERMSAAADIFLLGNHDAPYMFPNSPQLYCPGFTKPKAAGIREILGLEHWQRFQLAHAEQGWLLSHAGFHPVWIAEPTIERILARCDQAMEYAYARKRIVDPIFGAGEERGGNQLFGGPTWMDWSNLVPIPGINQIVGHTPGEEVREKIAKDSNNYCLDVKNASVAAILSEGELTILRKH